MDDNATVHFCCNSRGGNFLGWCEAIHIEHGPCCATLTSRDGGLGMGRSDGEVVIAGLGVPCGPWSYYTGNLMWDSASMHIDDVLGLMRHVLARGFGADDYTSDGPLAGLIEERP